jgi:hypothetical protein
MLNSQYFRQFFNQLLKQITMKNIAVALLLLTVEIFAGPQGLEGEFSMLTFNFVLSLMAITFEQMNFFGFRIETTTRTCRRFK